MNKRINFEEKHFFVTLTNNAKDGIKMVNINYKTDYYMENLKKEFAEKWEKVALKWEKVALWWIDFRIKFFERYDECQKRQKYTKEHRKAFLIKEKEIRGINTFRGCIHDWDKPILYWLLLFGLTAKQIHKTHRFISPHHNNWMRKTEEDYIEMAIDWECASITKKDKPLLAFATLFKLYPKLEDEIIPVMIKLKMITEEAINQAVEAKLVTPERVTELLKKHS